VRAGAVWHHLRQERRTDRKLAADARARGDTNAIAVIREQQLAVRSRVAEIGDVTRFPDPTRLTSWAGLTPKHHESDTTVHRGRITKQGSRLVRWAAVEAVQRAGRHSRLGAHRDRIAARRGRNIGTVAAARELLELVYYALRDHTVRRLNSPAAAPAA